MKTRHFLLILALCALPATAMATTTGVNTIQQAFMSAATGWYTQIKTVAEEMFAVLFGVDIVWMVTQWLIGGKDVHEIFTSFIKKMLSIGFFFTILLNGHALAWDVIAGFKGAGVAAAGAPHTGVEWILDTGARIFNACLKGPTGSNGSSSYDILDFGKAVLTAIVGMITGVIVGLVAIFALIYMALEYISVQIEAILVTSLGIILLGFGGSKFTASYVEGYIKYAVSLGVRLFVLVVWISFVENQSPAIITGLLDGITGDGTGGLGSVIYAYGDVLIFVLLIAWLTKKLPALASSILTGSSSLSGGELLSGAVKLAAAAATGGAAAAAGGAWVASKVSSGAMSAGTGAAGSSGAGAMSASPNATGGGQAESVPPPSDHGGVPDGAGEMSPSGVAAPDNVPTSGVDKSSAPKDTPKSGSGQPTSSAPKDAQKVSGQPEAAQGGQPASGATTAADGAAPAQDGQPASGETTAGSTPATDVALVTGITPSGAAPAAGIDPVAGSTPTAGSTLAPVNTPSPSGAAPAAGSTPAAGSAPSGATPASAPASGSTPVEGATPASGSTPVEGATPSDGVDHRPDAPNNDIPSGTNSSGKVAAPTVDPAMQNLQSQMNEILERTAPKPRSLSEKMADTEKSLNQKLETVTHGKPAEVNVSGPGFGVKHLSD